MDDGLRRKTEVWKRLRDVPPGETLTMGFDMMEFARDLAEAADRAKR